MLQVARLAPKSLGDAARLVADYLRSQLTPQGGFADRAGNPDLYYTVFGLEGLIALRADLPAAQVAAYLRTFGDGNGLDLIHLGCLARCWANLPKPLRDECPCDTILAGIERHRAGDGGYSATPANDLGTIYASFVALNAYQDCGREPPRPREILRCIERCRAQDGGYANGDDVPAGLTPPTAAAVTLLRALQESADPALSQWLLARHHPEGGIFATPMAPIPDLLSTATALHALAILHADISSIQQPCLDFLDTLWTARGGFYGSWSDETLDVEYTFYGLLALGHLSV
jgi:prenyltransferase beta subunit